MKKKKYLKNYFDSTRPFFNRFCLRMEFAIFFFFENLKQGSFMKGVPQAFLRALCPDKKNGYAKWVKGVEG